MISVIILAAGVGKRTNLGYNKMLYNYKGLEVYKRVLEIFKDMDEIIFVKNKDDEFDLPNNVKVVIGGNTRGESVYNGLKYVTNEYVLIHDGARCFTSKDIIEECKKCILNHEAIGVFVPVKDTIKIIENGAVKTLNRSSLVAMQTPQGGKTSLFKEAYQKELENGFNSTDDLEVVEKYSRANIHLIEGNYLNIKITSKEDLI